ncbi:MAG TPA: hypothetical protein DCW43_01650 [Clostridiales bacterium]|nr:hypothetical protein [Clostridiales bacterium]
MCGLSRSASGGKEVCISIYRDRGAVKKKRIIQKRETLRDLPIDGQYLEGPVGASLIGIGTSRRFCFGFFPLILKIFRMNDDIKIRDLLPASISAAILMDISEERFYPYDLIRDLVKAYHFFSPKSSFPTIPKKH